MAGVIRNWLEECYAIHAGDKKIKLKRKHVEAAVDYIMEMAQKTQKLHSVMHLAYAETCKKRQAQGLPMPAIPEALRPFLKGSP